MEAQVIKTREEIEKLKMEWLGDPCWDIEYTEGFKDHEKELREFSEKTKAKWVKNYEEKMKTMAMEKGMDIETFMKFKALTDDAERSKREAKKLLTHYFGFNISMTGDYRVEVEEIVDHIVDAAVSKTTAFILSNTTADEAA